MKTGRLSVFALGWIIGLSYGFKIVTHRVVEGWPWRFPFGPENSAPAGFTAECTASRSFPARLHKLTDLQVPSSEGGLGSYADAIKFFFGGRPFPGSWEGIDAEDVNREIMAMEWADVPGAMRDWLAEQQGNKESPARWLFAVYPKAEDDEKIKGTVAAKETPAPGESAVAGDQHKTVLFPPGSLYEVLPLWVGASADGKECQDQILDLTNYNVTAKDGGVVAWPTEHTSPDLESGSRDISFTITAQLLKEIPGYEPPVPTQTGAQDTEEASPTDVVSDNVWLDDVEGQEPVIAASAAETTVSKPAKQSESAEPVVIVDSPVEEDDTEDRTKDEL